MPPGPGTPPSLGDDRGEGLCDILDCGNPSTWDVFTPLVLPVPGVLGVTLRVGLGLVSLVVPCTPGLLPWSPTRGPTVLTGEVGVRTPVLPAGGSRPLRGPPGPQTLQGVVLVCVGVTFDLCVRPYVEQQWLSSFCELITLSLWALWTSGTPLPQPKMRTCRT